MMDQRKFNPGWVLLTFMLGGLLLYATALDNGFYLDDQHQIIHNSFIRALDSIPSFFVETFRYSREPSIAGHYRPLLLSSFALNYAVDGYNPIGYHLVNLAFHVGASFLVFLMVRSLLGSFSPALAAGLIMLCNPFNAEVVNYVTARSSVMAAFFYLLSFFAYSRFRTPRQEGKTVDKAPGNLWSWVSLASFTLGMLTKEILITLPLVLILYEGLFVPSERRPWSRVMKGITPFLLLSVLYLFARKLVVGSLAPGVTARDFTENVLIQFKALAATLQLLLFPVNLSLIHDITPPQSAWDMVEIGSILLFIGILVGMAVCLRSARRDLHVLGFAAAWFYITLLPTVLIPLNQVLQENRGYIGGVAFALVAGVLFFRIEKGGKTLQRIVWGGIGLLVMVYGTAVWERNRVWGNELDLWQEAARNAPHSATAHTGLGVVYYQMRWLEGARNEFEAATRLDGRNAAIHAKLGALYMEMHQEDLSEKEYHEAIRLRSQFDKPHLFLGILYRRQGKYEQARQELESALRIYPFGEAALINLSSVYQKLYGDVKAVNFLKDVLQKNPNLPEVRKFLGLFYAKQGDSETVRRLDPSPRDLLEAGMSIPDGKPY